MLATQSFVTDSEVFPLVLAGVAVVISILAEWLHMTRIKRMSRLAFGPGARPRVWTYSAPVLRCVAMTVLAWSFATLLLYRPADSSGSSEGKVKDEDIQHVVFVLDVSPSMILAKDAGVDHNISRRERTKEIIDSLMDRMLQSHCRFSLVAFHDKAITIVKDCFDQKVIDNLIDPRLPLINCFSPGKTMLLDGVAEAMRIANEWPPGSTTIIILTDGDTVPDQGIPEVPASIANVLVVGIGNTAQGQMIDDHASRQDKTTLKQIARRVKGEYINCNTRHVPTESIESLTRSPQDDKGITWDRRRLALILMTVGSLILALLPAFLRYFGTSWTRESGARPGLTSLFKPGGSS